LVHYAHWVTPPIDVRRFDTHFFVTRVPPHQTPVLDDHEATDSLWIKPAHAIAAVGRRDIVLPPPTWASLRELERFASVDAALIIWMIAAAGLFVPLVFATLELSSRYPDEGGIYVWSKRAFGPFPGFITGWSYWASNLPYYPSLLYFAAGNLLFAGGPAWQSW